MAKQEEIIGLAKYRRGWYKSDVWRFCIERLPSCEVVIRLPFKIGISFYEPWWQIVFGIARSSIGIQWEFLCFSGEVWRHNAN